MKTKKTEEAKAYNRLPESAFNFPHMSALELVLMVGALVVFAAVATPLVLAGFLTPKEAVAAGALGAVLILLFPHL